MSAKRRLIPKLQLKASQHSKTPRKVLVTTVQFNEVIEIGDPVSQAKIYEAQAADELIFVDLDSTRSERETILKVVEAAAEEIFMPFTVGGGVTTLEDFRLLLSHGADKVSINTAAIENPDLITKASDRYGAQCVVVSIDFKRVSDGKARVFVGSGKKGTSWELTAWAKEVERLGAGELLLTSIDRDGCRNGMDIAAIKSVTDAVKIPVIASGGCGLAAHFVEGFLGGGASAVSAGTFFCFKDENPMQCRSQIKNAGIPIRIIT